jgi:hypothetical protein
MTSKEQEYTLFTHYFVEIVEQCRTIKEQMENLYVEGRTVSPELKGELLRHESILNILTRVGKEMHDKTPEELYFDGSGELFKAVK